MADPGPLKSPDPWAHIRTHAAEGGLYACAIEELLERLQHLEARPEVQVLPTTPKDCGPTLLVPAQLWPSIESDSPSEFKQPLLNEVAELIDPDDPIAALGTAGHVIRACASYLAEDDWDGAAAVLKRVADRG